MAFGDWWVYYAQAVDEPFRGVKVRVALGEPDALQPIKIGVTEIPSERVAQVSTKERVALRVVGVELAPCPLVRDPIALARSGRALERSRHAMFDEYRLRGEWFRPGPHLVRHLEMMLPPADDVLDRAERDASWPRGFQRVVVGPRFRGAAELEAFLSDNTLSVPKFAKAAGIPQYRLNPLMNGRAKRSPSADVVERVRLATNGRVTADMWRHPAPS